MAELYNEGLIREGLLRTTNLVLPGLISKFDTIEEFLTRFGINGVEAALALDFIVSEYRTGNTSTTFADAFTGSSPKLTYSTSAGSNSTMVNSSGEIVWAPHNLVDYSDDLTGAATAYSSLTIDSADTFTFTTNTSYIRLGQITGAATKGKYTARAYISGDTPGDTFNIEIVDDADGSDSNKSNVTVSATPQWVEVTADFSGSSTFSGTLALYINRSTANRSITAGSTVTIKHIHIYRSDLGGMHPVPQSATGFEYYVPTNGNPEYLPRVGHHVYNGSAWVNEGLLIESEPRTNLVTHSDFSSGWGEVRVDISTVSTATAPDGTSNVTAITSDLTPANSHRANEIVANPLSSTGTFTYSAFVRANGTNVQMDVNIDPAGTVQNRRIYVLFDLQAGTAATPFTLGSPNVIDYGIQDAGGGWYRCHVTTDNPDGTRVDVALTLSQLTFSNQNPAFDGDGTSGVYVYGAQFEVGEAIPNTNPVQYKDAPTPSSYMPTSGGTYTRTAQSLEVPPAQFGWPEPEYIGPELVDEASDLYSYLYPDAWTIGVGSGYCDGTQTGLDRLQIAPNGSFLPVGVYVLSYDVTSGSATYGVYSNSVAGYITPALSVGSHSVIVNQTSVSELKFIVAAGDVVSIDNISVREINPLAVSIQMDGRMDYIDGGTSADNMLLQWFIDAPNRIYWAANGQATENGTLNIFQVENNFYDQPTPPPSDYFAAGNKVPFNIASRHGSTFVNGAVDGTALTADTTPTALPDLSGTNLQIAYDFMGTIGTFRQFAGDIGDTGLVTATNPSTEPTLSLTFDGTNGSFYNLSWSE